MCDKTGFPGWVTFIYSDIQANSLDQTIALFNFQAFILHQWCTVIKTIATSLEQTFENG